MNSVRFVRKALMVAIMFAAASNVVFAQEARAAGAPVLHYFGAALKERASSRESPSSAATEANLCVGPRQRRSSTVPWAAW